MGQLKQQAMVGWGKWGIWDKKSRKKAENGFLGPFYFHEKKNATKIGKRHDNMFLEVGKNIEKRNHNLYYLKFQILTNPRKNVKSMKT